MAKTGLQPEAKRFQVRCDSWGSHSPTLLLISSVWYGSTQAGTAALLLQGSACGQVKHRHNASTGWHKAGAGRDQAVQGMLCWESSCRTGSCLSGSSGAIIPSEWFPAERGGEHAVSLGSDIGGFQVPISFCTGE